MHPPLTPLVPILGTNTTVLLLLKLVTWKLFVLPPFPLSSPQVPSVSKCYQFHQVSIRPSLRQFIPPSLHPPLCGPVPPSSHLSVSPFIHPSIPPFIHLSVCLSLCPSFYPSLPPLFHPSLSPFICLHPHSHHSRQSLIFSHLGNLSSLPTVPCVHSSFQQLHSCFKTLNLIASLPV